MTGVWRLSPRATLEGTFSRKPGPFGSVGPDTSKPLSLYMPPEVLGTLQHVAGLLREAWRTMVVAAISRDRMPDRGEGRAILESIAREQVAAPPFSHVLALDPPASPFGSAERSRSAALVEGQPLRLAPTMPLQVDAIQYPLDRLAWFGDRRPEYVRQLPVRAVIPVRGPSIAMVADLIARLVAGMTAVELRSVADPTLAGLVGALQFSALFVEQATTPRTLAPGVVMHLGHATLLANLGDAHVLVDPWLPPASKGDSLPPLAIADLPPLAGIFITHHHWDHVHVDTLLQLPKHVPIYVPAQDASAALRPRTEQLLAYLGFTEIRTLAPGDAISVGDGGEVVAAPFYGEDPTRLRYRGCCYVLRHRGASALVHVDSSTDVDGRSLASTGDAAALVATYGPLDPVFATRRQERGLAIDHTWDFLLQPSDTWLAPTENCHNGAADLAALARATGAKRCVIYSEGGADWYPDGTDFLRRATPTARAAPFEYLWDSLATIEAALAEVGTTMIQSSPFDEYLIGS